ncbi:MAG: thioredoxin-related protein [Betaproteobacteria bacterium]|nr:thioredoxin-related protein [Betaproteobacteria bacterium]
MPTKFKAYHALIAVCLALAGSCAHGANAPQEIEVPAWFKVSFLDVRDDLKEAAAARKRVMLYFGQNGCPYCRQLMEVNFKNAEIVQKTRRNFDVIEINIVGSRDVTWTDGSVHTEKAFARHLKIGYTPTLLVLDERGNTVVRISGYLPPAAMSAALDYVIDGAFRREPDLRRYLKSRAVLPPERGSRIDSGEPAAAP